MEIKLKFHDDTKKESVIYTANVNSDSLEDINKMLFFVNNSNDVSKVQLSINSKPIKATKQGVSNYAMSVLPDSKLVKS